MHIIKNFGFMWSKEKVNWGTPGPGGAASLNGQMVGNRHRKVDFRKQMGIYVLYDRFEQPVQVGQAGTIFTRLKQHQKDHLRNRWAYFSWFGFYQVGAGHDLLVKDQAKELTRTVSLRDGLNQVEAVLIQVLEPRLNRSGPNWTGAEEYLQVGKTADPDLDTIETDD